MQVAKWGNSLAVRLPAAVVEALELKEGDEVEIYVADRREFGVSRKPGRKELLTRLRAFRGRLRNFFRFLASAKIFRVLAVSRTFAAAGQIRVGNY